MLVVHIICTTGSNTFQVMYTRKRHQSEGSFSLLHHMHFSFFYWAMRLHHTCSSDKACSSFLFLSSLPSHYSEMHSHGHMVLITAET